LKGEPIDYDHTIRFLGYAQDNPNVAENTFTSFTLCWEVLQTPVRAAAYSIKLFDQQGQGHGDRTTVHGTGRYNSALWRPGDRFCEDIDVMVKGPLQSGQALNVLLVLLDAKTSAVDWQATGPDGTPIKWPFIGQVVSP